MGGRLRVKQCLSLYRQIKHVWNLFWNLIYHICIYIYDSQIVHHSPCFNLLILHNNSFDNQRSEINESDVFLLLTFRHTVFYKNFLPTTIYIITALKLNKIVLHCFPYMQIGHGHYKLLFPKLVNSSSIFYHYLVVWIYYENHLFNVPT